MEDIFKFEIPYFLNNCNEECEKQDNVLQLKSNQLANKYIEIGLKQGDIVGVFTQQRFNSLLAHITTIRSGMISLPLSTLSGQEELQYQLFDSCATCVITDVETVGKLLNEFHKLPNLKKIIVFSNVYNCNLRNFQRQNLFIIEEWNDKIGEQYSKQFEPVISKPKDPVILLYKLCDKPAKTYIYAHDQLFIDHFLYINNKSKL